MPEKKDLIIVITRADARKGSANDEFVFDWEFKKDEKTQPVELQDEKFLLYVLHGCKENIADNNIFSLVITETIKKIEVATKHIDEIYLFTHGVDDNQIKFFSSQLESRIKMNVINKHTYSSHGGSPLLALDKEINKIEKFKDFHIRNILNNGTVFKELLLDLQKNFLWVYIFIQILRFMPDDRSIIKDARELALEIENFMGSQSLLDALTRKGPPCYSDACSLLRRASGYETSLPLFPEEFWRKFSEEESFSSGVLDDNNADELIHSFNLVSQSINIMQMPSKA